MKQFRRALLCLGFLPFVGFAQTDPLQVLSSELDREFAILSTQQPKAYYLDYEMKLTKNFSLSANFGEVIHRSEDEYAFLVPTVRVGSEEFDNTHSIKGRPDRVRSYLYEVPVVGDSNALLKTIWNATDQVYNDALNEYRYKRNNIKVSDSIAIADFSTATGEEYLESENKEEVTAEMEAKIAKKLETVSHLFHKDENIIKGWAKFRFSKERSYFVSSEGHRIAQNHVLVRITIEGAIRSTQGNQIELSKTFDFAMVKEIVSTDRLLEETEALIGKLVDLRMAEIAEPYTGPAILSAEATGVFFHEIFGHRVEGHRFRNEANGNTFKEKLGELVLPKSFSVVFDPAETEFNGIPLNGHYLYDDQGVKGEKVTVVNQGVLTSFLMSRTPIAGFEKSNGHGRSGQLKQTVSRQSNMFITTDRPQSMESMRKQLKKMCKKSDKEYGYYFKTVTGGFTNTSRIAPNAFNVKPTEVYRIYVDGRPDELVRGVNLIGTPLSMFSTILSGGEKMALFNGYCGAESGQVPVSCIAPALLVGKIETQKKSQKYSTGPILKAPTDISVTEK